MKTAEEYVNEYVKTHAYFADLPQGLLDIIKDDAIIEGMRRAAEIIKKGSVWESSITDFERLQTQTYIETEILTAMENLKEV